MAADHKNVLLLIADDLGRDYLGCYGSHSIKTPNIDRLAAEGTRFTNAFASTASCSGSRSTIYTGLHTHQNGQYGLEHGWNHFQTFEYIDTVPTIFNSIGYQTGIIGKVHVGPRRAYPWEVFNASPSRNVKWVAGRAAKFFDKTKETSRPFHLTIGFTDPHRDDTRGGFANDFKEVLDAGLDEEVPDYDAKDVEVQAFMSDVAEHRTELVQYYKSISRMDLGVGLILAALKERKLDENTLVVFVSDNGKDVNSPSSPRVVLMLR
jgi:N-sulfoglucosamine sulfohydrolase